PEIAREAVAAVDLLGTRRNVRGGETAHALAQHVGGLAEAEIESPKTASQHGRWPLVRIRSSGNMVGRAPSCNQPGQPVLPENTQGKRRDSFGSDRDNFGSDFTRARPRDLCRCNRSSLRSRSG